MTEDSVSGQDPESMQSVLQPAFASLVQQKMRQTDAITDDEEINKK